MSYQIDARKYTRTGVNNLTGYYPVAAVHKLQANQLGEFITVSTGDFLGVSEQIFANEGETECHISYEVKLSATFADGMPAQVGKLPGLTGVSGGEGHGNNKSLGTGWSCRVGYGPPSGGDIPMGIYIYHMGQAEVYGDAITIANVPRDEFFKVSISCIVSNGFGDITCSINGTTLRDTYELTNTGVTPLGFWMDVYAGGGVAPVQDESVEFRNMVIR